MNRTHWLCFVILPAILAMTGCDRRAPPPSKPSPPAGKETIEEENVKDEHVIKREIGALRPDE